MSAWLKYANESESLIRILNTLLSDKDFYVFLEDLEFKSAQVRKVINGNINKSYLGNFDVEGYFVWDLQKFAEKFILKQLQKYGLQIEDNTVFAKE